MNIGQHLNTKRYWKRRRNPNADTPPYTAKYGAEYYADPALFTSDTRDYYNLTQEDFCRENEPTAHDINSDYMSRRAIYGAREKCDESGNVLKDENGEPINEWYVSKFENMETVSYGLQKRINLSKAAYLAGNGFWITHEDSHHEKGNLLNSWKDSAGLDTAWQELVKSCCLTGDGAIYLYILNGTLQYEVFSYLKGDILFPEYDENRNPILYRLYILRGRKAVDIYACGYIETWVQDDKEDSEAMQKWWRRVSGWFAKGLDWRSTVKSEDGWRRLVHKKTQAPSALNQCVYWRVDDIPSGICEGTISALERAASFLADGVRSTSQAVLFLKAADIESLPQDDATGKKIGVRGTVEELAASDAKYLDVPDVSNIATLDINNKMESILKSSLSVNITPDIFKSGADSSAAMKLLFTDVLIWCKNEFTQYYPQLKYFVEVFKSLVSVLEIENGGAEIATMRTSCGCDFWIPQNDSEVLKREIDMVTARIKSRKAAMSDAGNTHVEDYEQVKKEWGEEIEMKSRIPAEAKAEVAAKYGSDVNVQNSDGEPAQDDEKPKQIDNRLPGKSIVDG